MLKPKRKMHSHKSEFIEGATQSIKKTLKDIECILDGEDFPDQKSKLREELREKIKSSLTDLAVRWYKKGFNRGHKESYRKHFESGCVPMKLETKVSRSLIPGERKSVKLKSSLKSDFIAEIEGN